MAATPKTAPKLLPLDANQYPVQTGGGFCSHDGTATPVESPLTVSTTVIPLVVPTNAAELIIVNTSNDLRVSEEATCADYYFVVPGSTGQPLSCMKMSNIYLLRDGASDAVVQFYFKTI